MWCLLREDPHTYGVGQKEVYGLALGERAADVPQGAPSCNLQRGGLSAPALSVRPLVVSTCHSCRLVGRPLRLLEIEMVVIRCVTSVARTAKPYFCPTWGIIHLY